jgi:hypothetical protein
VECGAEGLGVRVTERRRDGETARRRERRLAIASS